MTDNSPIDSVDQAETRSGVLMLTIRLFVSGAGLAGYILLQRMFLPTVDRAAVLAETSDFGTNALLSPVALGLGPFVVAFLIVELCSFVVPVFRKARGRGAPGRRLLTRASVVLGLVVCAIQSHSVAEFLRSTMLPSGNPVVSDAGMGSTLVTMAVLTVGSAVVATIGLVVSRFGLSNGFALLFSWELLVPILQSLSYWQSEGNGTQVFMTVVVIGIVAVAASTQFFSRITCENAVEKGINLPLVPFPQGVVPLLQAAALLAMITPLATVVDERQAGFVLGPLGEAVLLLLFVPLLSMLGLVLFSSNARIERNLGARLSAEAGYEHLVKARFVKGLGVLLIAGVTPLVFSYFEPGGWAATVQLGSATVILVAFVLDVVREIRFRSAVPNAVAIVEFDNVHLAQLVEGKLRTAGVRALTRGSAYRSLFFFFEPMVKMTLLVDPAQEQEARRIVDVKSIVIL